MLPRILGAQCIYAVGAKLLKIELKQFTFALSPRIDVQCAQDEFRKIVRPAAASIALPVQKARRAVDFEKAIPQMQVAMQNGSAVLARCCPTACI